MRDIADAHWLAEVCARLIDTRQVGTVNCGTGTGYSVFEIARKLTEALGRADVKWEFNSTAAGNMLTANIDGLIERIGPLSPFKLEDALRSYVGAFAQS